MKKQLILRKTKKGIKVFADVQYYLIKSTLPLFKHVKCMGIIEYDKKRREYKFGRHTLLSTYTTHSTMRQIVKIMDDLTLKRIHKIINNGVKK